MITGVASGVSVLDLARKGAERIPNARTSSFLARSPLDLVGRCGGSPEKGLRKAERFVVLHIQQSYMTVHKLFVEECRQYSVVAAT